MFKHFFKIGATYVVVDFNTHLDMVPSLRRCGAVPPLFGGLYACIHTYNVQI